MEGYKQHNYAKALEGWLTVTMGSVNAQIMNVVSQKVLMVVAYTVIDTVATIVSMNQVHQKNYYFYGHWDGHTNGKSWQELSLQCIYNYSNYSTYSNILKSLLIYTRYGTFQLLYEEPTQLENIKEGCIKERIAPAEMK